jgi:hypothetical protein
MKKIINVSTMKIISHFNKEQAEEIRQKYESLGYVDVQFDIDGDLCVWEDE